MAEFVYEGRQPQCSPAGTSRVFYRGRPQAVSEKELPGLRFAIAKYRYPLRELEPPAPVAQPEPEPEPVPPPVEEAPVARSGRRPRKRSAAKE